MQEERRLDRPGQEEKVGQRRAAELRGSRRGQLSCKARFGAALDPAWGSKTGLSCCLSAAPPIAAALGCWDELIGPVAALGGSRWGRVFFFWVDGFFVSVRGR
jgi:hypothetical protein